MTIPCRMAFTGLLLLGATLAGMGCDPSKSEPKPTAGPAARTVRVAAAADLKFAMDEVVSEFQKRSPGIKITTTYGSSGHFYSQLSNRAPFDIYFSADIDYPRRLVEAGLAVKETQFDYAIGQIVVWVRHDSPIGVEVLGIESLVNPSVRKIAIANPKHAPYGVAAEVALKHLSIYDRVKNRLVLGENIAQTAQFIEAGAADIGLIALSLAMAPTMKDRGKYWIVPLDAYPRLEQGGVILTWAKDMDATRQFKTFVTGSDGRAILQRYGFMLPGE